MSTFSTSDYLRRRRLNSDLTSDKTAIAPTAAATPSTINNSKNTTMPVSRTTERNSTAVATAQRAYSLSTHLPTQYEENTSMTNKNGPKRAPETPRKSTTKPSPPFLLASTSQPTRRLTVNESSTPMRGRANTDIPLPSSSTNNNNFKQTTSIPGKPKCMLPTTTCQPGYVTPSKLFNMMGYGLDKQYLFMLTHYLYIIDCRSREKFIDNHIVTAIHWEDALNGTVYISFVERFSEIVLYDDKGIFFNTTTEMRRVSNRFSNNGNKTCVTLSGGFEAFHTFYPFVCTQIDIRSIADREKYLTIYPSVVLDNQLYLGTGIQATNWKVIRDLKITHVINISIEHLCPFPDKIKYLHLELEDVEDVLLKDRFDETTRFIELALEQPSNRVLVHCNLGISRSTTVLLAYLMKTYNATLLDAFKFLRHRRPIVCPNSGFLQQLVDYETELFSHTYTDPSDPIFR